VNSLRKEKTLRSGLYEARLRVGGRWERYIPGENGTFGEAVVKRFVSSLSYRGGKKKKETDQLQPDVKGSRKSEKKRDSRGLGQGPVLGCGRTLSLQEDSIIQFIGGPEKVPWTLSRNPLVSKGKTEKRGSDRRRVIKGPCSTASPKGTKGKGWSRQSQALGDIEKKKLILENKDSGN